MKKYELTNEKIGNLSRIRALRDFGNVRAGELGGFIESENNLSHHGDAWVFENARVSGDAWVFENARVFGDAWVFENARVFGNAWVRALDRITKTHQCASISGPYRYPITVTPWRIGVGCMDFTPDQLDEEHDQLGPDEVAAIKAVVEPILEWQLIQGAQ